MRWKRALFLLIAAILVFLAAGPLPAYAERDTVHIGFFISDKYGYVGADGVWRGYDIQLSKTIGMYGGFDAEMVGYDNVTDMENALRAGEVDALIDFLHTDEREQEFIFTNTPILEEQVILYTDNAPGAGTTGEVVDIGTLRIGYVSDSGYLDYFMEYCRERGVSPEMVEFDDEASMHAAMDQGETNACLTGSAVPTGYRVLATLPPLGSYMMLRKGEDSLRNRIDSAIIQLKTDDPDYLSNLYRQYIGSHSREMSPLSSHERDYIAEHPELSVAVVRGAEPFATQKEDGSPGGIVPDYYAALGEKIGVKFRFVFYDTTQDAIDAVASGETDILGHYYGDVIIAEKDGLYDTMEYGSTDCARLTKSDFNGEVRTAAATTRTAYFLAEQLDADISLKTYPNLEACYEAMMRGEVDAMIGSMTGITWLTNQHTMRDLSLSVLPNVMLGNRGAVSRDNPTLLFILNKAIAVSVGDMDKAVIENAVTAKTDLRTALENLPIELTIAVVAVLAILATLLIIALVFLARSSRERVALMNREMNVDGLTGAGSRRYGTELLNRELQLFRRYGNGPMVAMFDVDHFKEKNDTYGHEYGDFVLKKVVEVLRATLRESDVIIRWGGDEFILVFPQMHEAGVDSVLEKVIRSIGEADFTVDGNGTQVTISLGASFFQPGDGDIVPLLRRCDSALYEAKSVRNAYRVFSDDAN